MYFLFDFNFFIYNLLDISWMFRFVNVPILRGDKMRKSQKVNRSTNKQLMRVIQNRFNNVSLSDLQTKDIINRATNYGKHKTNDATIFQIALDTLKEDKPYRNMVHLGRQLEKASIESGYYNSKGKWVSTFYVTTNLPKIDFNSLGVKHQTHNERMRNKKTLKAYKKTIDNFHNISSQSD